jgi:hypothetical protein
MVKNFEKIPPKKGNNIEESAKRDYEDHPVMEFLLVYGWAILVVIAAIAALAYFGVLDPANLVKNKNLTNSTNMTITEPTVIQPSMAPNVFYFMDATCIDIAADPRVYNITGSYSCTDYIEIIDNSTMVRVKVG